MACAAFVDSRVVVIHSREKRLRTETGKSVYPVEERPMPQSDVPGATTWPTQPIPVKPPALARNSIRPDYRVNRRLGRS